MSNLAAVNKPSSSTAANRSGNSGGANDAQPTSLFGALLAQQVSTPPSSPNANAPAQPATVNDKKSTTDKKASQESSTDPKIPNAATAPVDPAGNLIALLPPPPTINTTMTATEPQPVKIDASKIAANALPTAMPAGKAGTLVTDAGMLAADAGKNIVTTTANASNGKIEIPLAGNRKSGVLNDPDIRTNKASVEPAAASKTDVKSLAASLTASTASLREQASSVAPAALSTQDAITNVVANMQQSLNATPAHLSATEQQSIASAVGSNRWSDEFSQKITWVATNQNNQIAELHLNPPDLGPLNVVIKISENQATASFSSSHSEVRDAVTNAIPALREVLANSGITLGNTTVSDQAPKDGNAAFSGQQSQQQSRTWSNQGGTRNNDEVQAISARSTARKHDGMVDTFA